MPVMAAESLRIGYVLWVDGKTIISAYVIKLSKFASISPADM